MSKTLATVVLFAVSLSQTASDNTVKRKPIKHLEPGDTLTVGLEYIDCRLGPVAYPEFRLTRTGMDYFIQHTDDPAWYLLESTQTNALMDLERSYLKDICHSTSYVVVHLHLNGNKRQLQTCWADGDELVSALRRR